MSTSTAEDTHWTPWTPAERESFFDAVERHRRASWRITAVCAFAVAVLAFVLAVLLAPLLVCVLGIAVDVVNLVVPMPDVLVAAGRLVEPIVEDDAFSLPGLVRAVSILAIPGLVVIAVAVWALNRALKYSPLFDMGDVAHGAREPDRSVLAEQRLANVVEEMAIAAGIPAPHVLIVPGGINAAAFGRDASHVTLLVGDGMLAALDRGELQGAVAHLVGSIAGGDMPIGMRAAVTFALFGLMGRLTSCFGERHELRGVLRLLRTLVWPTRAGSARLVEEVADPFGTSARERAQARADEAAGTKPKRGNDLTWREWALMPLMGPVVMSGFVSEIVCTSLLKPLVAIAWRRRKYMADAAAVRLTRDPDTLASTLHRMMTQGGTWLAPWAQHMAVAPTGPVGTGLIGGVVSLFPPLERRYRALVKMGATPRRAPGGAALSPLQWAIGGALAVVVGGLLSAAVVLLIGLSIALSGLFTILPVSLLHAALRAVG